MTPVPEIPASSTNTATGLPEDLCHCLLAATRVIGRDWKGRDASLRELTEMSAGAINVARVSVWLYDEEQTLIRCLDLFDGRARTHDAGTELERDRFAAYFQALDDARIIDAADAHTDPRTREFSEGYLDVHGIGAMLDAPIWIAGELAGVVCHEHVGEARAWSTEEQAFAASLGDLVSLVLETARRHEAEERLESRELLFDQVAKSVAGRTGSDYFESMTGFASTHLGADLAFVGELNEDGTGVRTVAAWLDGSLTQNFDYDLVNTPCLNVMGQATCSYPSRVSELFPEDRDLVAMKAQGYVGTPLFSSSGAPLGIIVAVFKQPLADPKIAESILQIFAARAAGELERVHIDSYRDRLEAELLRAQRLESVGRLAGGIAHDFNNLLAPIIAYTEMALDALPVEHPIRSDLQEIMDAAERAARLTRQLLAFGRQQVLEEKSVDLNLVVDAFHSMIRPVLHEDIDIVLDLHPEPLAVLADSGQVEQVLMNLVVNAQDAMPNGGHLTIRTSPYEILAPGDPDLPDLAPRAYARMSVSDSGVGIDPETAAHMFEPFFTTKKESEGTGLGLSTVYGIVQQHGGTIRFGSEPDGGTRFDVFLPGSEPTTEQEETKPHSAVEPGNERILVVEDEGAVRRLVVTVLNRNGYDVLEAEGPIAALELLQHDHAHLDLLLTDVVMPGMNGVELYKQISKERPGTKVLYMSGYAHEVIAGKGLGEGINLLPKPFSVKDLAARVRASLDG